MKVSKKAEYALQAVLAMARAPKNQPVQIQELAEAENIPVKFLEQILLTLKKGQLLQSKRGVGGGYQLNRAPF
ncbi:MAG: Rrf2 family transcriptional regulator, partial [Verrucomicrobiota bacterium]